MRERLGDTMGGQAGVPSRPRRARTNGSSDRRKIAIVALFISVLGSPALAACPIELAVYADRDNVASLDFRPAGDAAAVTNRFRMALGNVLLDGMVMWSEGVARPNGILTLDCPLGDVTGPEYEACTLWQGVIYGVDDKGEVGLLPAQGADAPQRLIFPDLAYALAARENRPGERLAALQWDVFSLSGCQE